MLVAYEMARISSITSIIRGLRETLTGRTGSLLWSSFCQYFVVLLLVSFAARMTSLYLNDAGFPAARYDYWLVLARGLSSDAVSALLVALLALASYRRHGVFYVLSLAWAYFHAANIDYIEVNRSYLPFSQLDEALDATFLIGSALSESVLLKCLLLTVGAGAVWLMARRQARLVKRTALTALVMAAIGVVFIPYQVNIAGWKQLHPIEGNATEFFYDHFVDERFSDIKASADMARKYRHLDLSGSPRLPHQDSPKPRNIIILAVEGLSNQHLEQGMTPYLRDLAGESLYVPHFLALNRMTLNGTYAINCGTYPPLASRDYQQLKAGVKTVKFLDEPRALNSTIIRRIARKNAKKHPCLPKILASAGYETVYLQGAHIGFMGKSRFLPMLGFREAYGVEAMPRKRTKGGWGLDDGTLLNDYGIDMVRSLQSRSQPWLLYFMTVGTHHPFNVLPRDFMPKEPSRMKRAYRYVDQEIKTFVDTLRAEGVLDSTLLLITSDESLFHYPSDEYPEKVSTNQGVLLVFTPEGYRERVSDLYTQADIYVSLLDYLGKPIPSHLRMGRSVFRQYTSFRPLVFGESYRQFLFGIPKENTFIACSTRTKVRCSTFMFDKPSFFDAKFKPMQQDEDSIWELIQTLKSVSDYP
jgi:hypothetical protein